MGVRQELFGLIVLAVPSVLLAFAGAAKLASRRLDNSTRNVSGGFVGAQFKVHTSLLSALGAAELLVALGLAVTDGSLFRFLAVSQFALLLAFTAHSLTAWSRGMPCKCFGLSSTRTPIHLSVVLLTTTAMAASFLVLAFVAPPAGAFALAQGFLLIIGAMAGVRTGAFPGRVATAKDVDGLQPLSREGRRAVSRRTFVREAGLMLGAGFAFGIPGTRAVANALDVSNMFKPASADLVRRGAESTELNRVLAARGLTHASIKWNKAVETEYEFPNRANPVRFLDVPTLNGGVAVFSPNFSESGPIAGYWESADSISVAGTMQGDVVVRTVHPLSLAADCWGCFSLNLICCQTCWRVFQKRPELGDECCANCGMIAAYCCFKW